MPKVTKIEIQKNNKDRHNVYLDGRYSFPISTEGLLELGLKVGVEITNEKLLEISNFEFYDSILQKLIYFISYRPRSKKEIETKLRKLCSTSDFSEELRNTVEEKVISRLEELGLYNDDDFVKLYIESAKNNPIPPGYNKVKTVLMSKGVKLSEVGSLLEDYKEFELKGAQVEFEKRFKKKGLSAGVSYHQKAQIAKFLTGKGYSWEVVKALVDSKF